MTIKIKSIFVDPYSRRVRAVWRLFIQLFLFALGIILLSPFLWFVDADAFRPGADTNSLKLMAGFGIIGLISCLGSVYVAGRWLDQRSFIDFGFRIELRWWRGVLFGLFLGTALMIGIFLLEYLLGWVQINDYFFVADPDISFKQGIIYPIILFVCVGIYEELLFRGYQLTNLVEGLRFFNWSEKTGWWVSMIISSIIFGLMHANNPNANWVGVLNISLAGIFLAFGYYLTGELAIPIGLHISWNFVQGTIFGFPVSGTDAGISVVHIEQLGPDFWTGGAFGPEAGFLGLLAIVLGTVLIWYWVRKVEGIDFCR